MRNSLVVVRIDNIYIYNIYTAECIELSTVGLAPARPNYGQVCVRVCRGVASRISLVRPHSQATVVYARIARSHPLLPSYAYFGTKILVRPWPDWPDWLLRP